jgi:hypothetical protein
VKFVEARSPWDDLRDPVNRDVGLEQQEEEREWKDFGVD